MFNPFEVNKQDVKQLFEFTAVDILINGKHSKGIITENTYFRETEDKHLHTLDPITTGDYIQFKGHDYLIVNETITKRHHKFKAIMRHCNYPIYRKNIVCRERIETGGRPEYRDVYGEDHVIQTITSQRTFSIDERYAVRVVDKAVIVSVQDTELNRESLFVINGIFKVKDVRFKVVNHERSVKGVLSIWGETTQSNETIPESIGDVPMCD